MMRCCKHCGALLEDEAKVCDFCGAILEVPAPVEPAPQPIETAVATDALPEPTPKKKIPKKKWFIFTLDFIYVIMRLIQKIKGSKPLKTQRITVL